jgi:UDPglucose 6-dehydrogenase
LLLVEKARKHFRDLKGKKLAIWGLAFKPDTDDIREAPAMYIIEALLKEGAEVRVFDPAALENTRKVFGDKIVYGVNAYDILKDADALLIATEWALFRTPDFAAIQSAMKSPVIFDGRNLYGLDRMKELKFHYESIGRKAVHPAGPSA